MLAIINSSTLVTDVQGALIVKALNTLLPQFCKDWNIASTTATYIPKGKTSTIATKFFLLDSTDVQGALGYHDLSSNVPYGKCFVETVLSDGGVLLYSNDHTLPTFAQIVCHEVFELLVDPLCNRWWDIGDGQTLFASEVCDPVESNAVTVSVLVSPASSGYSTTQKKVVQIPAVYQNVGCSDWILPEWSNPQAKKGPFNHLNTLKAPFTLDKGGYGIQMTGGSAGNVFAMLVGSEVTKEQQAKYLAKLRIRKRLV